MATRERIVGLGSAPVLLLALAIGCTQGSVGFPNPFRGLTGFSEDDERRIGMEFDRSIQKQVEVIHDPLVAGFINELGQSIVAEIEPQPFIYRFRVIKDPSLNAFAVPGGYVYFHSGTILAAGSIDELAGVMGHEIAHVKGHHYVRMQKKQRPIELATTGAAILASVFMTDPTPVIAAQALNVSMGLKFSRDLEAESDHRGSIWVTRAGYDPAGITRFFERILEEQKDYPDGIPPYLFSHPDVEERIETVRAQAEKLRSDSTREPDPQLAVTMLDVQERLHLLIETGRANLPILPPEPSSTLTHTDADANANADNVTPDAAPIEPLLDAADELARAGDIDAALLKLAHAGDSADPRVPFAAGELLFEAGRYPEAVAAYRRTVLRDSTHARVFYKLGLAHKHSDQRHQAVWAFEQAVLRASPGTDLRQRVDWEIEKLTFQTILAAGFTDGSKANSRRPPPGRARDTFTVGDARMLWWARLGETFVPHASRVTVRWTNPEGVVVQENTAEPVPMTFITSVLEFDAAGAPAGEWTVEALLDDDVVDVRNVRVDR